MQHEALIVAIKKMLSVVLNTNNYDSVTNFILFHDEYAKSNMDFTKFFMSYQPPITNKRHTCVGLGLELIRRMKNLDCTYKDLSKSTSLVSCEESVNKGVALHVTADGPYKFTHVSAEKEHVMVGVLVSIEGRPGILIADPGYHVGRVVTVMVDGLPPHTGYFVQHNSDLLLKEYNYIVNQDNNNYVEWHEREIKHGKYKYQISLVYVARPYLSAIEVTEKRNVVYGFRSQLRRDANGNIIAGYYFPLTSDFETASFTGFIGLRGRAKYRFKDFLDRLNIAPGLVENIELICSYMNCSHRQILDMISKVANIMSNREFMVQLLGLNNKIRSACKIRRAIIAASGYLATDDEGTQPREQNNNSNPKLTDSVTSISDDTDSTSKELVPVSASAATGDTRREWSVVDTDNTSLSILLVCKTVPKLTTTQKRRRRRHLLNTDPADLKKKDIIDQDTQM